MASQEGNNPAVGVQSERRFCRGESCCTDLLFTSTVGTPAATQQGHRTNTAPRKYKPSSQTLPCSGIQTFS